MVAWVLRVCAKEGGEGLAWTGGGLGGCPKGGGGPGRCCTRRGGAPALVEDGGLPAGLQLLLVRGKFGEGGMGLGC